MQSKAKVLGDHQRQGKAGERIFSGVQPSGIIHIGNYLGAIKQWVKLQYEAEESIFCVVDLHAITVEQEPKELQKNILSVAALYLAAGIDPKKSSIFVQSTRPEHAELAWILNCYTSLGQLSRMTQFKEKTQQHQENAGLFTYPVLMAADILLYQTTAVPVGEDQKQHLELARDLAQRFNKKYGQTFVVPNYIARDTSKRIMGLDNPYKKMSKSASSPLNYIAMTDDAKTIRQKIKKAVTDSGREIKASKDKPAITNLLNIFSEISGKSVNELEKEFQGKSYREFKETLAGELIKFLQPIQERYQEILRDEKSLRQILNEGSEKVRPLAQKTLSDVKRKIGLGI